MAGIGQCSGWLAAGLFGHTVFDLICWFLMVALGIKIGHRCGHRKETAQ